MKLDTNVEIESSTLSPMDGSIKFVFRKSGLRFEGIYFDYDGPDFCKTSSRVANVVCVSSQAGCAFGCVFCATGKAGLSGNLEAADIIGQFSLAEAHAIGLGLQRIDCVALMGMGEPLSVFESTVEAARSFHTQRANVTFCLSTVGIRGIIRRLAETRGHNIRLYISIHSAFDEERVKIIPSAMRYGVSELLEESIHYSVVMKCRVTLSYLLLDGVNDSELHADALARIASPQHHSIQILLYNDIDDTQFARTSDARADRFHSRMRDHGFFAYIQRSQGRDISGGCGQLDVSELSIAARARSTGKRARVLVDQQGSSSL